MATTYKVTGAYVTAAVSGETGSTVLGFSKGATLPSGVSPDTIKHLLDVGLIAAEGTAESKAAGPSGQEPQTSSTSPTSTPSPTTEPKPMSAGDDPGDFNVTEVQAYLATADEAEKARVLEAEKDGKNRSSLLQ